MVFSSIVFLGIFLPIVLLMYFIIRNRTWRNFILLIASVFFYAWGEPVWVVSMIALAFLDYIGALVLSRVQHHGTRRMLLVLFIILNLALLFMFKYYNFMLSNVNGLLKTLKFQVLNVPAFPYAMPIGISFFTFQALSYIIDVYRGDTAAQKNYFYVLLYISMFPQLIAGPIVRYTDIEHEILNRHESPALFAQGGFRFCIGLAKKVILANFAGSLATALMTDQLSTLSAGGAWIGILMYTFQIYFDFSGYSDMAIGLGKIFGFNYLENFNYPYIAGTVTDFWRRWHISLSTFFRDYVYIPLGGNRRHQFLNILIVWSLTGLWHGASWNFLLWGLYYAILLIVEKCLQKNGIDMGKIPIISNVFLLLIIMYGWAIFYYTDTSQLFMFSQRLLGLGETAVSLSLRELTNVNSLFWLIPIMVLAATPWPAMIGRKTLDGKALESPCKAVWAITLLAVCFVLIMNQTYNPFLYFRF
ncbi:MAG: MBOAT family O-acyltransferase [Clostridia bacterium]